MASLDIHSLLLFSAIFRVILIVYGEWQDAHMEVRYTDVDYLVFSDAAALMAVGDSPYKRTTYRYSPLLAFLLIPNSFIHRSWGKFLFSASGKVKFSDIVSANTSVQSTKLKQFELLVIKAYFNLWFYLI